jgi:eukaryotic-like serine/threonine-protein kinase
VRASETASVTAERWQQIKAIVAEALEEKSPAARMALVANRCGEDAELRREVESLVDQTTSALENFAEKAGAPLRQDRSRLEAGRRMGPWAIVRELGRGGMGAVYLAERADGAFQKQVAIKVLKRGTDTDEILRRFEAERQILARLDHPNITRLIDAGTTEDGLPYVVMDYVIGKPITQYAGEKQLSVTDRLKLFRAVCSAVSYAHQNLVVHRDLKPSNILVTESGEVRLLDFGIAKLLSDAEAGGVDMTITVLRVMTPEYASPEQIKGEPITTLSDVYSLGVCLYELLTGARPYKLTRKTSEELSKAICEQEPERPSTAVAKGDGSSKLHAPSSKLLRGDLDNIVLMALRKEPARRYASVEQFSEDIRRHLENLPVRARKDTAAYRASKFMQRHKLGVVAAALVALTLIVGSITTAWQAHQARLEKAKAEQRFNQVRKLAHSLLFDYHDAIAALPGSTKVRERLVKDALSYLDNLSNDSGNDIGLLRELAAAYEKVASVQGGAGTSLKAYGRFGSSSNLGDTQGALESMRKAQAIRERLVALQPRNRALQTELAFCYAILSGYYSLPGPPEKVLEYANKALPTLETSLAADPGNEDLRTMLGATYLTKAKALGNPNTANLGDIKGALDFLGKAQPIFEKLVMDYPADAEDHRMLGAVYNLAGLLAAANGNLRESLAYDLKAAAIDQRLVDLDPTNTFWRSELAIQLGNAGSTLLKLGDNAGALEKFKQALAIYESLIAADPNDVANRRNAAVGYRNVAVALAKTGDSVGALANFPKALQIFSELVAKDPTNADLRRQWALIYLYLSRFQADSNQLNDAIGSALEGVKIEEKLVADAPTNMSARNNLAQLHAQLGKTYAAMAATILKPDPKAREHWRAAKEAYQKSFDLYQDMKTRGTLSPADATKPDEIAREIAKCDAALK